MGTNTLARPFMPYSYKSSPHSFYQQINNNQQRKEKEAKRKENQTLTHT
jgi:hypothetical protein